MAAGAPSREASQTGARLPSLDGLRGLSIAFVLVSHAALPLAGANRIGLRLLEWMGALGVSVFFIISGFLITYLLLQEEDRYRRFSLPRFYLRRVFRIFPAYYVFLGATAAAASVGWMLVSRRDLLAASTFLWNYWPGGGGWNLAHTWSLSVEEQFYLLWPVTLLLAGRRHALKISTALIVLAPFVRVATYFLAPAWRGHIGMMLHTRVDSLMFGCALALVWDSDGFARVRPRLFRPALLWLALLALLLASPALTIALAGRYTLAAGFSLQALCATLLLAWCVSEWRSAAGRVLNARPLVHLGLISYSLYLWQQPFARPDGWFALHGPLGILLPAVLAAEVSYFVVEQPFLRLRSRIEARLPPRPRAAAAVAAAQPMPVEGQLP
ncbi:MAG TPA: acyltransferase [Terriglobales bacterium]|nr:acyltransferase [Terriglobales bacterium]